MKHTLILTLSFSILSIFSCGYQPDCKELAYFYVKNECDKDVQFELRKWNYSGQLYVYQTITIHSLESEEWTATISCKDNTPFSNFFPAHLFRGDSACIIFSDSSRIYYRLADSTSKRNLLYLKNYEEIADWTYVYIITEDDHQTAIEECGM